jgi:hypothetical protein
MNTNINFHEEYSLLDIKAKARLKEELENVGGEYEFGEGDEPIVIACPFDHPSDYVILKAFINEKGDVCMIGREVEDCSLVNLSCEDIEGSHLPYIWEYIDIEN